MVVGALASKEDIGIFSLIVFFAEIMAIFITFGADSAIVKFYQSYTAKEVFNNYIFQSAVNTLIVSIALYAFGIIFYESVYRFVLEHYGSIVVMAIAFSITTITRAHLAALRESAKVKWLAIISGALNLLSILFFTLVLSLTLFSLIWTKIIGALVFFIYFGYILITLYDTKKINIELTKKIIKFSMPLLISTLVGTVSIYLSRIILAEYVSVYELGVFSFFIMIVMNITLLLHSFNQAWFPFLFNLHKSSNEYEVLLEINKKIVTMLKIGFIWTLISTIIFILSNHINFDLNGYYHYRYIAFILMDSLIFGGFYIIINPLLYIKSRTEHVAYASFIILILNLLVTIAFVELLGLFGAAVSAVFTSLLSFLLYWIFSQKYINKNLINRKSSNLIIALNIGILIKYFYIYITCFLSKKKTY
jgi:O-antigen/teichoic acid export membrane protein